MLDQRLREGTEAVKAALADAIPPAADELFTKENVAATDTVGWRGPLFAVATALVVLTVVAAVALLFRSDGFTGEPAAPAVSTPVTTTPAFIGDTVTSWRVTDVAEPWAPWIVDVAALPSGGFVVVVDYSDASVLWSTDGKDWVEADPEGMVAATVPAHFDTDPLDYQQPQFMSVVGDKVAVLDAADHRVWVGDLTTRTWESISLDTTGLIGDSRSWAIASNDRQILVAAKWSLVDTMDRDEEERERDEPAVADHVVWLIDPETGSVERNNLPLHESDRAPSFGLVAVWFEDRWVIAVDNMTMVSHGGMTWTRGLVGRAADPVNVTSLTAGHGGIVATTCQLSHETFFSDDGIEWIRVPEQAQFPGQADAGHFGAAYSDELGFVFVFPGGEDYLSDRVDYSRDGRTWSSIEIGLRARIDGVGIGVRRVGDVRDLAASGTSIFVHQSSILSGALILTPG